LEYFRGPVTSTSRTGAGPRNIVLEPLL